MAEKTKHTIVKPVAGYKHGEIIEVEKLPLALQAHVIKTPEDSVSSGSDDKEIIKNLKSDLAAAKKEIKALKDEIKASKEEPTLEVATPETAK